MLNLTIQITIAVEPLQGCPLYYSTHLNTGTGDACAGHRIAAFSLSLLVIVCTLFSDGNFGSELPMGSKMMTSSFIKHHSRYNVLRDVKHLHGSVIN